MKLDNTLSIPVPVEEAWQVLLDIERIAPCVPGATLTAHDGDQFQGKVKVKLGPIGLTYNGTVTFVSLDEAAKVAVLEASGREARGGGTAKAVVTCQLVESGGGTDVLVETELAITGKPAQFGRSALSDVATTLIDQFAANLATELAAAPAQPAAAEPSARPAADAPPAGSPPPRPAAAAPRPAAEPIDLFQTPGGEVVKRAAPIAAVVTLLLIVLLGRRRRRSARHLPTGI
ncbi:carbon monoxide dehydrogenase [Actinomadura craniellae]|uniref:Carbon monoxide dehydrogenase n=1 Tax=Actinomadura craniellae TaxID=2231787 RepID=A0A365H1A3_9ACTN|nr:SRPBCC family protein [Actinomadura craniellae]RAY12861.1 carbon monoxide dehydrogenase [Actinomadura craniellae]